MITSSPGAAAAGAELGLQVSPKLKLFFKSHEDAAKMLTNVIYKALEGRTVQLYYYYSKLPEVPRASHTYTDTGVIFLQIQENQEPVDEFICILYEALNSKNEARFKELFDEGRKGTISKSEFALTFVKLEFQPTLATRDLIMSLNFSEKEKRLSYSYPKLKNCPDNFEDYLNYQPNVKRNRIKEYEQGYDELRAAQAGK